MRQVFFAIFTLAAVLACQVQDSDELTASDLWLRPMPPGQSMTAAYGTIYNPGPGVVRITGFSSPAFERVELHETRMEQGIARMRRIHSLELQARDSVILEPGGKHLMMIGARQSFDHQPVEILVEIAGTGAVKLQALQGQ